MLYNPLHPQDKIAALVAGLVNVIVKVLLRSVHLIACYEYWIQNARFLSIELIFRWLMATGVIEVL